MYINSIKVQNFRGISSFDARDLKSIVVIAGPNGCGKTTILDAIRLLKTVYVPNESQKWFSEFGIRDVEFSDIGKVFRDPSRPVIVEAEFELTSKEASFLRRCAYHIGTAYGLVVSGRSHINIDGRPAIIPTDTPSFMREEIEKNRSSFVSEINKDLDNGNNFKVGFTIKTDLVFELIESSLGQAAFACFNPDEIGEIEFHGARRNYSREAVSNIRLNIEDRTNERKNRLLFDIENKYRNIKTQLGEEYISFIMRNEDPENAPIQKSIKELFHKFFPGKEFLGIDIDKYNNLSFPVRLDTGEIHDIDELSSGEKEIVYGYLVLRTGTPKQSVILIDEPELHLNPALLRGLAVFYLDNLADALQSQVFMITHSDSILRQAVQHPSMSVLHMTRPLDSRKQQAIEIDSKDSLELAVIDLIGAAYMPHAQIVLIEGDGETRFDVDMINQLFPDLAELANFIPIGNRAMTSGVRAQLLSVLRESGLAAKTASISDADLGVFRAESENSKNHYIWPVYEIENFLLDPMVLGRAISALLRQSAGRPDQIVNDLRAIASGMLDEICRIRVTTTLNSQIVNCISFKGSGPSTSRSLSQAASRSLERISKIDVGEERVRSLIDHEAKVFREYLETDAFLAKFPGHRMLNEYAGKFGIQGSVFRNACLDQARSIGYRPKAMEQTLLTVLDVS